MKSVTAIKVIPIGDRAGHHLCKLYAHARRQGPFGYYAAETIESSLGLPEGYSILADRYKLRQAACKEVVRVAATRTLSTLEDLEESQAGRTGPVSQRPVEPKGAMALGSLTTPVRPGNPFTT